MIFRSDCDILAADLLGIELHLEACLAQHCVWHREACQRVALDEWIILAAEVERPQETFFVQMKNPYCAVGHTTRHQVSRLAEGGAINHPIGIEQIYRANRRELLIREFNLLPHLSLD